MPGQAEAISADIDVTADTDGVTEVTARHRDGDRLVPQERCDYITRKAGGFGAVREICDLVVAAQSSDN